MLLTDLNIRYADDRRTAFTLRTRLVESCGKNT
jgi:hypothetical protein